MPRRARNALTAAIVLAVGLVCAACGVGFGPGPGTGGVMVTVTRDFGSVPVRTISDKRVPGSTTVMRMLERSFTLTTSYGGGFVDSIDGLAPSGAREDWFYYVNGVLAPQGAASTPVNRGDHIWWDLHDWSATQTIPAVVGSFPEPFTNGYGGKRYPTTLECAPDVNAACQKATDELDAQHVPFASQLLGTGSGSSTLGIVVGTWADVKPQLDAQLVAYGPGASGVYARFVDGGRTLELLDPHGGVVTRLGAGAGLVAATGDSQQTPVWLVTGTDAAGVAAAAAELTPAALHDHFALAVAGGHTYPVPLDPSQ